jgi:hypothetical protein
MPWRRSDEGSKHSLPLMYLNFFGRIARLKPNNKIITNLDKHHE